MNSLFSKVHRAGASVAALIYQNRAGFRRGLLGLGFFIFFLHALSMTAFADIIDLSVTYGYQNTAKAGRFLPLTIGIDNTEDRVFSGTIHVYMVESKKSVYEYRYPKIVEGKSSDTMNVTISLSSGVNQLLVTAEDRDGAVLGSRRIGLDVSGSDAELIIGLISENSAALSYLNGVGINDGILRTRTVKLDPDHLPTEETALDQLDVLLISHYTMEKMDASEAKAIRLWVQKGGYLILGTGAMGETAVNPYFTDLFRQTLKPEQMKLNMNLEDESEQQRKLACSPVYLNGGREVIFNDETPVVSVISTGAGLIAVCGYDFCDMQRFATDQVSYVDTLFSRILGKGRLDTLSVSASERTLRQYWDIQSLMSLSDLRKIPTPALYTVALCCYVLLIGPGLYFYMREHSILRLYRLSVTLVAILTTVLIWVMGFSTRFQGTFLTYARLKDISDSRIDEKDFINLRSPYSDDYVLNVKTEYYVYPVLKGSDYNGDITNISNSTETARTCINNERDKTEIYIANSKPFSARYFELDNKMPNTEGSFQADLTITNGKLSGTLVNHTTESLTDAAILMYGRMVKIGTLDAGQVVKLENYALESVPVGANDDIAAHVTAGNGQNFLSYYLRNYLPGFFSGARLVGFVRESSPSFTSDEDIESYGITMVVSSLPVNSTVDGNYSFQALFQDPEVQAGDYDYKTNTISGTVPVELRYHLGEDENINGLSIESLHTESVAATTTDPVGRILPFAGSLDFYNTNTGGFDSMDVSSGKLTAEELAPYLDAENVLTIRYVPLERNTDVNVRLYLPMLTVNAGEVKKQATPAKEPAELQQNATAESTASEKDVSETKETETETKPVTGNTTGGEQ